MSAPVRIHPAALQDAARAVDWYSERSERAAARFLDELARIVKLVEESPEQYPLFDNGFRRALFRHFPFYLVFRATEVELVILGVAHGKRRPGFWQPREADPPGQ